MGRLMGTDHDDGSFDEPSTPVGKLLSYKEQIRATSIALREKRLQAQQQAAAAQYAAKRAEEALQSAEDDERKHRSYIQTELGAVRRTLEEVRGLLRSGKDLKDLSSNQQACWDHCNDLEAFLR